MLKPAEERDVYTPDEVRYLIESGLLSYKSVNGWGGGNFSLARLILTLAHHVAYGEAVGEEQGAKPRKEWLDE